jgi:outer membrane receptor protein involved in Fe transport
VIDSRGGATVALGCWVNWDRGTGAIDEREAYRLDADWYIGDHSLRGGLDVQENNSIDSGGYSGGVYYRYYDNGSRFPDFPEDAQLVRIRHLERGGNFDVAQDAAYVQDSWAVTPNLTVNLGARYEEFDNSNRLGESFIKITDQWAPRVGFIWDPSGQGQQKVFGSFGRYHLPIASNTNIRASGGEFFDQVWYIYDGSALNPDSSPPGYVDCGFTLDTGCPNQGTVGELVQHQLLEDGEIPDPREVISENFDPMSQDEIILGYEQMLGTNWSAGARFVGREFNEVIEDYTVDEALVSVFGFDRGAFEYRLGNPGKEFIGWVDLNHDGVLTPDENVTFTPEQLRYPPAERKYYAVEVTAKRRFADNWMFQGSYTWSHTYGNYEGYVNSEIGQDDAGITQSFDLAGLMDGAYGNLPQDRRHNLKLWGAYAWDNGFQVGANAWFQSGRPINSLSVHPTDDIAAEYGAFSFFLPDDQGGALAPRGSQGETDNLWALDLMLKYDFTAGGANMNVRVDVFNLLDNDSVTYVEELSETDGGSVNPFYGQPDYYQAPLSVRVGFGVSF